MNARRLATVAVAGALAAPLLLAHDEVTGPSRAPLGSPGLPVAAPATDALLQPGFPFEAMTPTAYADAARQADTLAAQSRDSAMQLRWRSIGPFGARPTFSPIYQGGGRVAGRVAAIAVAPADPDVAYVGAATGGVWRTRDGGAHWRPVFDRQPTLNIGAVAVGPSPDTVYVGTGEGNTSFGPRYQGLGMFRSTDAGRHWTHVAAPFSGCFFADIVASAKTRTLVAAVRTTPNMLTAAPYPGPQCAQPGIWVSPDGGDHWTLAIAGNAWDLALRSPDPQTTSETWYATLAATATDGDTAATGGIYHSTDDGLSWSRVSVGLPPTGFDRVVVSVSKADPDRLYAAYLRDPAIDTVANTGASNDLLGVFTSADAGTTWQDVPLDRTPCSYSSSLLDSYFQCWYDLTIEGDPKVASTFYIGGITLMRFSLDQVASGQTAGFDVRGIHVDQHALVTDRLGRMWIGNDGGVYRTADGGRTFTDLNRGLAITQFNPGISGIPSAELLGGTQDNGTMRYRDGTWRNVLGGDGAFTAVDPRNRDVVYGSYQYQWLQKSVNGGLKWHLANDGINSSTAFFVAPFVMAPWNPDTLFAADDRVLRTTDGARRWKAISPSLGQTIISLGVSPYDHRTLLAGAYPSALYRSIDGGAHWTSLTAGLPVGESGRVVRDFWFDRQAWYVAFSGYGTQHVFRSTDHGRSWTALSERLPDIPTMAVATYKDTLYVGTDLGIWSTRDGGRHWAVQSHGVPPHVQISDLTIDRRHHRIVASTYGRGMFVGSL